MVSNISFSGRPLWYPQLTIWVKDTGGFISKGDTLDAVEAKEWISHQNDDRLKRLILPPHKTQEDAKKEFDRMA